MVGDNRIIMVPGMSRLRKCFGGRADILFVFLAVAFLLLVAEIAEVVPRQPVHLCAVPSMPVTCGDVR